MSRHKAPLRIWYNITLKARHD